MCALNLVAYLKTEQALWYWVTITVATIAVAASIAIPENSHLFSYFRILLGAIFVLWMPGYTLTKALFPSNSAARVPTEDLDPIERIALSVGMSLAIVPLVGLFLYHTPWGISLNPLVLTLYALTLFLGTVALIRDAQSKRQSTPWDAKSSSQNDTDSN